MPRRRALALLIACNLLWAGTYVAGKVALQSLSPVELNALRFGIASLAFLPLLWRARRMREPNRMREAATQLARLRAGSE